MQSTEEFRKNFDSIYYKKIVGLLKPFEQNRLFTLRLCIVLIIIGLLIVSIDVYCIANQDTLFPLLSTKQIEYLLSMVMMVGILVLCSPVYLAKDFEQTVKREVMPEILKNLKTFKWRTKSSISDGYINFSDLFADYNRRFDDDNFSGKYKGVTINICETELGKKSGSGKNSSYIVRFKGVLVNLLPEREFKSTILIKKRGLLNFVPEGLQEVNLEDVEFEKRFNVYGDDQIETRYVLTTAFMDRFKNIAFVFKSDKIEASIKDTGILIAITVKRDLFKVAKLYRPICDYSQFKQMIDEFSSILELIEELKLNQNIGL